MVLVYLVILVLCLTLLYLRGTIRADPVPHHISTQLHRILVDMTRVQLVTHIPVRFTMIRELQARIHVVVSIFGAEAIQSTTQIDPDTLLRTLETWEKHCRDELAGI